MIDIEPARLTGVLSVFDLSVLASASMAPAYSLAATMGLMIASAGSAAPIALVALALGMACIADAYALLSTRYPHAGSSYAWMRRAFGDRVGAFGAWVLLVSVVLAVLATAIPAGTNTLALLAPKLADSPIAVSVTAALWVLISGALLAAGIRPTAGVTAVLLIAEVIVLLASAGYAALHPIASAVAVHGPPLSFGGFAAAMVLAIWMVDGWELSAATSEDARRKGAPGRGGFAGLGLTTLLLLLCMTGYLRFLGPGILAGHSGDSMLIVGSRLGGWWSPLLVVTVLISTSSSLWTTMLYLTRGLFAMGRDGIVFSSLGKLDRGSTPLRALAVVTIGAAAFTLLSGVAPSVRSGLNFAVNGASMFLGLLFILTTASVFRIVDVEGAWVRRRLIPGIGVVGVSVVLASQLINGGPALLGLTFGSLALGLPFIFRKLPAVRSNP